ncbi:MAG: ATP-binding cassette domain-containing protein [Merismopedia sp. SIO2A8]|nr:ATP-binding cassette domain-containing protein [Merismopedia sp. SIO2A8]
MAQNSLNRIVSKPSIVQPSCILSVEKIGRKVQENWIWQNISFELVGGDRLAVVGPSGSGKSLLLRALAGLDPVQSGYITFHGKALSDWNMPQFRSQVIYLHQRPALFEGTVESNLQQVYRLAVYRNRTYARSLILGYLSHLGRSDNFLTRSTEQLSGGEQQIVACLRALQLAPQILLLDEPTASLDSTSTQHLEVLIDRWQQSDPHRACLWTSHEPAQIERVTTRKLILPEAARDVAK